MVIENIIYREEYMADARGGKTIFLLLLLLFLLLGAMMVVGEKFSKILARKVFFLFFCVKN
jgi:hypothetical protein